MRHPLMIMMIIAERVEPMGDPHRQRMDDDFEMRSDVRP
jgi:hypothetical protein